MNTCKEIIVFGGGYEGKQFCNMVQGKRCSGLENLNIAYVCDNHLKSGSYINGIKVINIYELARMSRKLDIYICTEKFLDEIMKQIYEMKLENDVYYVPSYVYRFKYNTTDMPVAVRMDINKPRLSWLEIMIVNHCNLNCNGCSACANISEKQCMDLEKFEQDLVQLKTKFSGIKILKLFGGEPLLHPQLHSFIECAREIFPDARLLVHSNGILVPKCDTSLLDRMRELDARFVFTLYPDTGKVKRLIELRLQEANVDYEFTQPVYEFRKAVNAKGDYDIKEVFANCCKCISLANGKLSCGFPDFIDKLEKKYNISICQDKWQNSIDIYTTTMEGWEIKGALDRPYNLCAYCAFMRFDKLDEEHLYFKWKRENPKLEDWLV